MESPGGLGQDTVKTHSKAPHYCDLWGVSLERKVGSFLHVFSLGLSDVSVQG